VSLRSLARWIAMGLLVISGWVAATAPLARAEDELTRRAKVKPAPVFPELARRMSISGVVKIQITVDRSGAVKNLKVVGGHPLLAGAAVDAIKKWKFDPGPDENTGIVEFRFDGNQ
jgi:TonB family protein